MPPRVIEVIESDVLRGDGTVNDPIRRVKQYHFLDGDFLAEYDATQPTIYEEMPNEKASDQRLRNQK